MSHETPAQQPLSLFEVDAPQSTDLGAFTARIAAAAAGNTVEEKSLSPTFADLGYRQDGVATREVPQVTEPARKRRVSTRQVESRYTDIGSDTQDSDPSKRTPLEVAEAAQRRGAMPDELRVLLNSATSNVKARRQSIINKDNTPSGRL